MCKLTYVWPVTPNKNFTGQKNLNNISLTIIIIGSDRNEKERKKSYQKKGKNTNKVENSKEESEKQ